MTGPQSDPEAARAAAQAEQAARTRASAAGLIFVLLLVVGGWFLVQVLKKQSALEDCLMAGRSNCAPIEVPAGR